MKKRTTVKQEVAYAPKEYLLNLLLFILFSSIPIYSSCDIPTESIYSFTVSLYLTNGEGNGNPLQYSCLENPMDEGAWWAVVHGVATGRARLRVFTFTLHFAALGKEMEIHSSVLAWRIPGMGEPGEDG